MTRIKVLIVDDSALVRQTFKAILETDPSIKVIGTAGDPYIAVQKIHKEKPDVITLDIEMPKMDGLTFLSKLMRQAPMPVVVISNQTSDGARIALKALEIGAVDVMTKPDLSTEGHRAESGINLVDKVRSAFYAGQKSPRPNASRPERSSTTVSTLAGRMQKVRFPQSSIIAVGASTGGTEAIKSFLEVLPAEMPPILIVQHMPEKFTTSFAKRLNETCALHVKEAENNEPVLNNTVYIAPGDHHMSILQVGSRRIIKITSGELVNRHRPSVNVLFNSVAQIVRHNSIGIILTGMGDDGATGMKAMHQNGAYTIAQDEETSVVYGMPYKAVLAGGVKDVLPLNDIPYAVCKYLEMDGRD
ncbi:chemotaxis response regulator protein-glutamate methylesterase [Fulvivirga ulvae]|uniref:protein-glutamate methylesterase/protein-glutamine glutaminase n=1 Tax=Fulvivirga ulvae TaxID=2904245 RepID=UPI001F3935CB|nr:chemotaxis response regulator protein-glutamate methylesterase [Fulvivirga ulvae]UII31224.1 chemotaxis response regulator protein-glutamate methylesterase [Fulvivirga ulvae]